MRHDLAKDVAISLACKHCFHQDLHIPETVDHPRLRVTYSTSTNFDDTDLPAVLFVGPMFATRWFTLEFDKLARESGVRLVSVDRPGFGGSTIVPLECRIPVWIETVPLLLQRLKLKYVSLVTHSAGTIYTLNTLFHHRALLDPERPFVAFLAPWVAKAHSDTALASLLTKFPETLLNYWAPLNMFINDKVMPSVSWSGGIVTSSLALVSSPTATSYDRYGYDEDTTKSIEKHSSKYQFSEDITGVNEEAKLCLKKCDEAAWGEAADYLSCIKQIAMNETALHQADPSSNTLTVEAFFAASDVMIGQQGQAYFERCWQSDEVKGQVHFASSSFTNTNHDSILISRDKGALKTVFSKISKACERVG